jgi:hypothetical protein
MNIVKAVAYSLHMWVASFKQKLLWALLVALKMKLFLFWAYEPFSREGVLTQPALIWHAATFLIILASLVAMDKPDVSCGQCLRRWGNVLKQTWWLFLAILGIHWVNERIYEVAVWRDASMSILSNAAMLFLCAAVMVFVLWRISVALENDRPTAAHFSRFFGRGLLPFLALMPIAAMCGLLAFAPLVTVADALAQHWPLSWFGRNIPLFIDLAAQGSLMLGLQLLWMSAFGLYYQSMHKRAEPA